MNEFASTSRSEFLVHDEWANDDVPFPTKSDALLATFALSKVADPVMVDNFFSLVMNPTFNPAECTLRTVTDIHSYACNYRKEIGNTISKDSSLSTIPPFVWQEVLLHIGAEYVAHACKLCDDAVHEAIGWNDGIFELESMCLESILDLRCASLVHRSWTGPAQRQLGRVLVLHNVNESTLTSAIRSTLYGNWTQILAMSGTGSIKDDNRWEGMDTLLPNLSYLKTFIARLPCLTMLHFESSVSSHPTVLFEAIKASVSPDTISIININDSVNHSTVDTLVLAQQHPGLRSLNLVGFRLDLNTPSSMEGLWSSSKSSQLSKIFISGSDYNLHPDALIQWVSWEKRALTGDSGKLTASEVKFRRAGGIYMHDHEAREDTDIPEDDNNVDFGALAQNHSLSWLPFIERIHLMNIHATESRANTWLSHSCSSLVVVRRRGFVYAYGLASPHRAWTPSILIT